MCMRVLFLIGNRASAADLKYIICVILLSNVYNISLLDLELTLCLGLYFGSFVSMLSDISKDGCSFRPQICFYLFQYAPVSP